MPDGGGQQPGLADKMKNRVEGPGNLPNQVNPAGFAGPGQEPEESVPTPPRRRRAGGFAAGLAAGALAFGGGSFAPPAQNQSEPSATASQGDLSPSQQLSAARQLRGDQRLSALAEKAKAKKDGAAEGESDDPNIVQAALGAGAEATQLASRESIKRFLSVSEIPLIIKSFGLVLLVIHLPMWIIKKVKFPYFSNAVPEIGEEFLPPMMTFDTPGASPLPKYYGYILKFLIALEVILLCAIGTGLMIEVYFYLNPCQLLNLIFEPSLLTRFASKGCETTQSIIGYSLDSILGVLSILF